MRTRAIAVFGMIVGLVVSVCPAALGQTAPPASSAAEKIPALSFVFTERIRQESSDNVTSLDESKTDSSVYVRFRTSLQAQWSFLAGFDLTVRLTNENRYYLAPKSDPRIKRNFDGHEIFFDSLNLKWTKPAGLPFTLTVGRQDLQFGEGFLIMDGGPLDGSRSAYFNGVRADWLLNEKNTITGFYVYQPRTDSLLPVLNDWSQKMVEQIEEGFGLYWTGTAGRWKTESYLFRKNVRAFETLPESHINILGGRARLPLIMNLELTTEAAFQFGKLRDLPDPGGNRNRTGFGGYFQLDHKTGARFPWPAGLTLGGIYLSGDDPSTPGRYEGWDPAFSRWPKWSESLIYLFGRESKPAFWTNFVSLYGTAGFALAENVNLNLTWHHLRAAAETPPSAFLSGEGMGRGKLFNARLNYEISKNLQGHFVWDYFQPGNYYFAGARPYSWVRFELLFRY